MLKPVAGEIHAIRLEAGAVKSLLSWRKALSPLSRGVCGRRMWKLKLFLPLMKQKQQCPKRKRKELDLFKTRPVDDGPEFMWREPRKSVPNIVAIHPSDARNSEITTSCWLLKVEPLVTSPGKLTKEASPPLGSIRQIHVGIFPLHQVNSDPQNDSTISLQQRPKNDSTRKCWNISQVGGDH